MDQYDLPLPEAGAHVWQWFLDLTKGRQNGMSINPISWPQIDAWSRLRRITPMQWELDSILGIDSAQIESVLEDQEKPKPKK